MGFSVPGSMTVSSPDTGKSYNRGLLLRQAAFPLWFENSRQMAYIVDYAGSTSASGKGYLPKIGETIPFNDPPTGWRATTFGGSVTSTNCVAVSFPSGLYNTYPILAVDSATGPQPWLYVPASCTVGAAFTGDQYATAVSSFNLTFERWVAPGETATSGSITMNCATADTGAWGQVSMSSSNEWIRPLDISCVTGNFLAGDYNFTIAVSTGAQSFAGATLGYGGELTIGTSAKTILAPHITVPPEFTNSQLPYAATRITASGLTVSNVTKIMNKEGTILAGRVFPSQRNVWNLDDAFVGTLHASEKLQTGLESGFYTFTAPGEDVNSFSDYVSPLISPSGVNAPLVRLDTNCAANYFNFYDADGGTTLAYNLDWHLEFRTTSALFQIALCRTTLETLHRGMIDAAARGFFFPGNRPPAAALGPPEQRYPRAQPTSMRKSGWLTGQRKPRPRSAQPRRAPRKMSKPPQTQPKPKPKARLASGLDMYLKAKGMPR